MLTKRTNILFDERVFRYLAALAVKEGRSVGELIRLAVVRVYFDNEKEMGKQKAFKEVMKLKKGLGRISTRQIRELIAYGRRY